MKYSIALVFDTDLIFYLGFHLIQTSKSKKVSKHR